MYRRPNLKETPPPKRNKKIPDPSSENPRALRDEHNRLRYITVGFRVSAEQNEKINAAVDISGLSKQEYCYRRCLCQDIVVQGNPKVYKGLRVQLERVCNELQRLSSVEEICPETMETIALIGSVLDRMQSE